MSFEAFMRTALALLQPPDVPDEIVAAIFERISNSLKNN